MTTTQGGGMRGRRRIIVIVPDEPGWLATITSVLGEAAINIEDMDGRSVGELGVITLRTGDDDAALGELLRAGLRAVTSDAIVFHVPDQPGALASVAQRFSDHRINVRTIHNLHRQAGRAVVAVTTDDDEAARALLDPDALL